MWRRGADSDGFVANFVESEQIMQFSRHTASFVQGVFSDLYVVKGTGIGHEIVSVHSLEPQFEHMADKIVLTVAEAMSLDPPLPVFVLIGATVHYCLKVIRGNIPQGLLL